MTFLKNAIVFSRVFFKDFSIVLCLRTRLAFYVTYINIYISIIILNRRAPIEYKSAVSPSTDINSQVFHEL